MVIKNAEDPEEWAICSFTCTYDTPRMYTPLQSYTNINHNKMQLRSYNKTAMQPIQLIDDGLFLYISMTNSEQEMKVTQSPNAPVVWWDAKEMHPTVVPR